MFDLAVSIDRKKLNLPETFDAYAKATVAASISQIKAEKYFGKEFNDAFLEITIHAQSLHSAAHEMMKPDVTKELLNKWHKVKYDSIEKIKALLPPFRELMSHMLQHDLKEP